MYGDDDLDAAVEAGIMPAQTARAFRDFVARRQSTTPVDEEHFRLLTGFNDIFVAVAIILVLIAAGWLGGLVAPVLAQAVVTAVSWGLAEYFTRRRRMALPSILLLLGFVGGLFFLAATVLVGGPEKLLTGGIATIGAGLVAAAGAYGHWRRFHVPITVAAGAVAMLGSLIAVAAQHFDGLFGRGVWPVMLACGLVVFALAMAWDASDRHRSTRRSDVAFWLHLAAAPLMVHPVFSMLGLLEGDASAGRAAVAVALYFFLALVALAVDRRALLISALVYVLYAIAALVERAGAVDHGFGLTALVLGSALLLLSASWHRARAAVVRPLPEAVRARLPVL